MNTQETQDSLSPEQREFVEAVKRYPLGAPKRKGIGYDRLMAGVIVLVLIGIFFGHHSDDTTTSTTATQAAVQDDRPTLGKPDMEAIIDASQHNAPRFDRDYSNRRFEAVLPFISVSENPLAITHNSAYQVNIGERVFGHAYCFVSTERAHEMTDWNARDRITVRGVVHSTALGNLWLESCELTKAVP
jgi:hypothetical protein